MGMCSPVERSFVANGGGGLDAIHLGHLHVHQDDIEAPRFECRLMPRLPLAAVVTMCPRFERMRTD